MTSKEALKYLDDIAHGRKMYLDAHELKEIIAKDLEDFEWLKSKLNLTFLDSLSSPENKERLLKIMGIEISYKEMM